MASALAAIHAAGIVHRDLSPQNLLRMGDGRLVLSDFGLATDASESTSVHGGTIAYMAPEVMRGGPLERSPPTSGRWASLMYEIVFGDKPRWSERRGAGDPAARARAEADGGGEGGARDVPRVHGEGAGAADRERGRGGADADGAARWWRWLRRLAASSGPLIVAGALTLLAAVAVGVLRARPQTAGCAAGRRRGDRR